ncbi:BnaCnng73820D, partial [Brassica napus]
RIRFGFATVRRARRLKTLAEYVMQNLLIDVGRLWGKTTNWVGFRVSVVWEGRHLVDGTVVAIKEIAMSEIFILRKINHPNIIHFIDMIEVRLLFLFPIRLRTSMFPKMSQACLTNFWMVAASEETSSSRGAASLVFVGEKVLLISEQRDWRRSRRRACDDLAAGFG